MSSTRSGATAVLLSDGRVLIAGGSDANGPVNSIELLGTDGGFSTGQAMHSPRSGHTATLLQDGRVLVTGGATSGGGITNSAEIYDPAADTWTTVSAAMVDARSGHTASLLQNGGVLLAGGQNSGGAVSSLEIFDPAANSFSSAGVMSSPRMNHAASVLRDGRILIVGGSDGTNPLNTSDIYDPSSGSVSVGANLSVARTSATATGTLDGKVVVIGGNNGSTDLASAEIYDPSTGQFSLAGASLATARSSHQAFLLPNNNSILVVGGSSSGTDLNSAELYYPWADTFQPTGAMSTTRPGFAGSALSVDGHLLAAGGTGLASTDLYGFATVKTDAADYPPGTTVNISGSGWQPGETVTLTLRESPLIDTPPTMTAVADSNGNIFNNQFIPDVQDVGVRFYLTAVGQTSGFQAQTSFTDALKLAATNFVISAPPGVANGTTVETSQQFTLTVTISNNNTGGEAGATWTNISAALTTPDPTWTKNTGDLTGAHLGTGTGTSPCTSSTTTTNCTYSWTITAPSSAASNQTFSVAISGTPSSGNCSSPANKCSDTAALKISAVTPASLSVTSGNLAAFQTGQPQTDTIVMSGQAVSVKLTVTNSGGASVNNASASALTVTPTGTVAVITCNAANPATAAIAGGSNQNFNYTCGTVGSGDGTLTFSGSASGTDALSGAAVSTGPSSSNSVIVDNTAPTMGLSPAAGSYSTPFSFSWNITDPIAGGVSSGVVASICVVKVDGNQVSTSCSGSQSLTAGNHTVTAFASDNAGNTGSDSRAYAVISDTMPPLVHVTFPTPVHGQNGWYNGQDTVPVVGTVTANDTTTGNSNVTAISCTGATVGTITGLGTTSASAQLTVSAEGTNNISCTATDSASNTGAGPGSTTMPVAVKIDTQAPTGVTGAANRAADHNGWFTSAVTINFTGTDPTSGIASCTSTNYSGPDNATASVSGHCMDNAGNQSSDVSFNLKYDSTPPTAALAVSAGTLGAHGWYTSDVTVTTSGADSVSNPTTCTADQFQTTETTGQVFNGSCTNDAGLSANAAPLTVKLDKTGPTATLAVTAGTLGNNGWYTSDVTVSTTGSDTISNPTTCSADQMQTTDTLGQVFNGSCTNDAGLKTDAAPLTIKRDATPPTVAITPDRSADHNGWYNHTLTFTSPGTDATSGIASCTTPAAYSGPDSMTASVSADCTDNAGNVGHGSFSFKYDATPPTNVVANADRVPDHNGWYNHALTVTWTGTDATSGIDSCTKTPYSGPDNESASLSGTCTDLAGNTSMAAQFSFQYDATPPNVTASPDRPADHNGWYNHMLTITFSGTDAISGIDTCDAPSPYSGPDNVSASVSGHCVDKAGNQGTATLNFQFDATPPTNVSGAPNRPADHNNWYNHPVTVQFSGTDVTSGIDSCISPSYTGPDTAIASVNGTCTDKAGNTSVAVASSTFMYDATPPTVTITPDRSPDSNGWYNHAVTFTPTGTDATSGIASCDSASNYSGPDTGSGSLTLHCTDQAGNTGSATANFKYDATPPTVTCNSNPFTFILNQPGSAVTGTVSDLTSGPQSASVSTSVSDNTAGTGFTGTITGFDVAGNSAKATCNYTVTYNKVTTFLQPWAPPGAVAFKVNSTVPLKWQYTDYSGNVVNSVNANPTVFDAGSCGSADSGDTTLSYSGNSGYQYDSTSNTWQFNWKTTGFTSGCYAIAVKSALTGQTDGYFNTALR